jgi:CCR4-NOT transcription complex subunit 6
MTSLLMRYEGAVLLLLQHRASQQPLLVCCTHLFWNPNFPDVKAMQAAIMCQQITEFLQQQHQAGAIPDTDVPVVIGGDFNSLWRKYRSDTWDEVGGLRREAGSLEGVGP